MMKRLEELIILLLLIPLFSNSYFQPKNNELFKLRARDEKSGVRRTACFSSASSSKIEFRKARREDIASIAELCIEEFDGPFPWFRYFERVNKIRDLSSQLYQRYEDFILQQRPHAMIVATEPILILDKNYQKRDRIVGFVEMGLLPSPLITTYKESVDEIESKRRDEALYLGNVVVHREYRHQSIGSTLVLLCLKLAEKFQEKGLFVTVKNENIPALKFYQSLGFQALNPSIVNPIFGENLRNVTVFVSK